MRTILRLFFVGVFLVLPLLLLGQKEQADSLMIQTYVFGGSENHYPYEMIDEKGEVSGFHIDLIREVAKASGFKVEFKFQPWYKNRRDLEAGKGIDISDMFYSEEWDRKVDFSQILEVVNYKVFIRPEDPGINSLEDLRGKKIIVEKGSAAQEELIKLGFTDELVQAETESDALLLLASGEHNYAIVSEHHGYWYIRNHDIELYSTGPPVFPQRLCFAVKEGRIDLILRLNQGLNEVRKNGVYRALYYKWFGSPKPKSKLLYYLEKYGWWALAALLLFIGFIVFWSALLKIRVRQRTRELRYALELNRKTEAQLRRSEKRLESTQAFSLVMMAYLDMNGRFRKVPPTLCALLQYDEQQLLEMSIQDIMGKMGKSIFNKLTELIQHERVQTYNLETKLKKKDGSKTWAFTNFTVMLDEEDHPAELLLFIRDINNEKVAEEKLRLKTQDLNDLIYKLSHDLRGPLTTIMGLVNLAKFDIQDSSANKFFHMIKYQVEFLDGILKDLSALQSMEIHGLVQDEIVFHELLDEVTDSLKGVPNFDQISIERTIKFTKTFRSDRVLLKIILIHLLENCLIFFDEEKENPFAKINVNLYESENEVKIEVADNGVGIEDEIQPHIFKLFYRGHEKSKGSGLGLFIVKNAIDKIHGKISFISTKGQGTIFTVSLPFEQ